MFSLSWDIEELKTLNSEGRSIHHELLMCIEYCVPGLFYEHNAASKPTSIRTLLLAFIKQVPHFRRTPATHVFVLMLSYDLHDQKPYALPVQCLPYAGLKEIDIWRIITDLCKAMISHGMKVSGTYQMD